MAGFGGEPKMALKRFVFTYPLPQCAKVIEGYQDPDNDDDEFSANDVIEIHRVTCPYLDLRFCRASESGGDVLVCLPTDGTNTLRFRVSSGDRKKRVFRGVEELIDKRPLYVRAIGVSADLNLPAAVLKGEVLRLVGVEPPQPGCQPSMLELKTSSMHIVRLPLDYTGNFEDAIDRSRLYTLQELASLGSVPRTLTFDVDDQSEEPPASIPSDFRGNVEMSAPQLVVEVSVKKVKQSSLSDDDDDDDDDSGCNVSNEQDDADNFVVPIDCEISVSPRPEDYESFVDEQFPLYSLHDRSLTSTDNVFRILSWEEETPMLQYHSIKPGDRLAFHGRQTVRKLLATERGRFLFVPVSHRGQFTFVDGASRGLPVMLSELSAAAAESAFPFRMRYQKTSAASASADPGIADGAPLLVEGLVSEEAILASKIHDTKAFRAFRLPLRTRISVGVEKGAADRTRSNILLSDADSFAEEVGQDVYRCALQRPRPGNAKTAHAHRGHQSKVCDNRSPPVTQPTPHSSTDSATRLSVLELTKQLEGSLQSDEGRQQTQPPVRRRSQPQLHAPLPPVPPLPPLPPVPTSSKSPSNPPPLPPRTLGRATADPRSPTTLSTVPRITGGEKRRPPVLPDNFSKDSMTRLSVTELAKQLEGSLQFGEHVQPPLPRRSATELQATDRATLPLPDPPRLPPLTTYLQTVDEPRSPTILPTLPRRTDFENRSDRKIPDSVYSYASDDMMWRDVGLFLSHNDKRVVSIPTDCDVSGYSTGELLCVMRMLDAPRDALHRWYKLRVDGRAFAAMSDDDLRLSGVDQPLVRQLRDCSRDSLRKTAAHELPAEPGDAYVTLRPNRDLP